MSQLALRRQGKHFFGRIPFIAELHQSWISRAPIGGYELEKLMQILPGWVEASLSAREQSPQSSPRKLLVVGYLKWWLEFSCGLTALLSGIGHRVDLAILPYRFWDQSILKYDLRRQRKYVLDRLSDLSALSSLHDLSKSSEKELPSELEDTIRSLSKTDVQYSLQRESIEIDQPGTDLDLFRLRLSRNRKAAASAHKLFQREEYDAVIVPNGSILEFGAVYRTARFLNIPVITFEFGEQRERIWLAQDDEVMRQNTDNLWEKRGGSQLTRSEEMQVGELLRARQGGQQWEQFGRQWQKSQQSGSSVVADRLGVDPRRLVVLLCTNVVGDSLALGREVFSQGMADWLTITVRHFAQKPEVQLIVRVHPGEMLGAGHPSVEILQEEFIEHPSNVVVVPPESEINTYDLIGLADIGLVYTSTVGLEMALAGIPVVIAGLTHYRGKGFSHDPESIDEFLETLDAILDDPNGYRLNEDQTNLAWRYAHRFFFEYPFIFPWHLVYFWSDLAESPLDKVLQPEVISRYQRALDAFAGRPIDWGANRDG